MLCKNILVRRCRKDRRSQGGPLPYCDGCIARPRLRRNESPSPHRCTNTSPRRRIITPSRFARPWKRRQRLVTGETLGSAFAPSSSVTGNAAEAALPVDLAFSRARGFGPLLSAQFRAYDSSTFLVIGICRSVILTG